MAQPDARGIGDRMGLVEIDQLGTPGNGWPAEWMLSLKKNRTLEVSHPVPLFPLVRLMPLMPPTHTHLGHHQEAFRSLQRVPFQAAALRAHGSVMIRAIDVTPASSKTKKAYCSITRVKRGKQSRA